MRSRILPLLLSLTSLVAFGATRAATTSTAAPPTAKASLRIEVKGVASDRGHVLVALYTEEAAWPEPAGAYAAKKVRARKGQVTVDFADLPAGAYAIAIMHDADDNGEMTKSLFGIPKEAYGFGNDARAPFSAPGFGESLVKVDGKTAVVVNIK